MRERPILFNTEMVQAILEGRKTQTRRVIKPQPDDYGLHNHTRFPMSICSDLIGFWGTVEETGEDIEFKCKYGITCDRLYVKETWRPKGHNFPTGHPYEYQATAEQDGVPVDEPWKPSIHMPKKAARIWLEITDIRVERVQDISGDGAVAEGIKSTPDYAIDYFASLWDSINQKRGYGWESNPWVWVVEFKRATP